MQDKSELGIKRLLASSIRRKREIIYDSSDEEESVVGEMGDDGTDVGGDVNDSWQGEKKLHFVSRKMAAGTTTKQTVRSRRMANAGCKGMHSIKVSGPRRNGKPPSVKIPPQLVTPKCMLKSPPETLLNKDQETVPRQRSMELQIEFSV